MFAWSLFYLQFVKTVGFILRMIDCISLFLCSWAQWAVFACGFPVFWRAFLGLRRVFCTSTPESLHLLFARRNAVSYQVAEPQEPGLATWQLSSPSWWLMGTSFRCALKRCTLYNERTLYILHIVEESLVQQPAHSWTLNTLTCPRVSMTSYCAQRKPRTKCWASTACQLSKEEIARYHGKVLCVFENKSICNIKSWSGLTEKLSWTHVHGLC